LFLQSLLLLFVLLLRMPFAFQLLLGFVAQLSQCLLFSGLESGFGGSFLETL
jgi:hypothetical protein